MAKNSTADAPTKTPTVPRQPKKGDTIYIVTTGYGPDGVPIPTSYAAMDATEHTRFAFVERINGDGSIHAAMWTGVSFIKLAHVKYDNAHVNGEPKRAALTWHWPDED